MAEVIDLNNSIIALKSRLRIFNQQKYDELVQIRRESDPDFNEGSSFFPVYRA